MKNIKQLREQYDLITEKEEAEVKKLSALVRAGLFDAKKLTSLKRALDKPVDRMTAQEKRMLLNLLDSLMSEVLSNQTVYQKVKQNVMKEGKDNFVSDRRFGHGYPSQKDMPPVLLLKRKAIRVFPDGQKVGLYYAQAIDKYVTVPFSDVGLNEESSLDEVAPLVPLAVAGARLAAPFVARGAARAGAAGLKYGKKALDAWKKNRADRAAKRKVKKVEDKKVKDQNKVSKDGKITNAERLARRQAIARNVREKGRKAGSRWKNLGRGALAVGAGLAGVAASLGTDEKEKKYFTPMSPKLQAATVGPKREGGTDTRAERERQASFRASKAMSQINETTEVNLDGNLFEINNKAANKVFSLYESLNKKNKTKMISMMTESKESFNKIVSFALGQK